MKIEDLKVGRVYRAKRPRKVNSAAIVECKGFKVRERQI